VALINNNNKRFIAFLLIASLLQGLIWSIITPPLQGPDEPAHFANVQHFSEKGFFVSTGMNHRYTKELQKSMDLLKLNKIKFNKSCTFYFTDSERESALSTINEMPMSDRLESSDVRNPAGHYPPVYYLLGSLGYRLFYESNIIDRLWGVRLVTIFITMMTILATYFIASLFFRDDIICVRTASCLMLLHPMHAFLGSCVNCDTMLCFISTVTILLFLLMIKNGTTWKLQAGICICIAIGLLTKPTFSAMIPLWLLAFYVSCRRTNLEKTKIVSHLIFITVILSITVVFYCFFGKDHIKIYFKALEVAKNDQSISFLQYLGMTFINLIRPWTTMGKRVLTSYWANFGWKDTPFPFFGIYIIALLLTIVATIIVIMKIKKSNKSWYHEQNGLISFALLGSILFYIGIIVIGYSIAYSAWKSGNLQGRYFFPTLSLHMIILAAGLCQFIKQARLKVMAAGMIIGIMFVWHIASFAIVMKRYYL
jgi:4-amino-4-deoxy-L-arabinose transferase-like glycosyltransferase